MRVILLILLTISTTIANGSVYEQKIIEYLQKEFTKNYQNIDINNIVVERYSILPKDFHLYKLDSIYLAKGNLRREKGSVSATFSKNGQKRKVYYRYTIDATVDVLRANQYIQKGKTITDDMVDFISIKFTNFYQKPITKWYLNRYRANRSIVDGKILTTKHITKITTLKRGDIVTAILRDGAIEVTFSAKTLKDGYVGDIIKIKRDYSSFFNAKIISATEVEIIE